MAMANSGQGGWNWLAGVPKRSAGLTGPQGESACQMPRRRDALDLIVEPQSIEHAPRLHVVAGLAVADDPAAPAGYGLERFRHLLSSASGFLSHLRNKVAQAPLLRQTRATAARGSLSPMRARLDATDWRILKELQANGRITNVELARKVGISPPPCLRRVRALEQAGMIAGYFGMLDEKSVGFEVIAFAMVGLHSQAEADLRAFENRVLAWPLVRECYMLSGETDFLLKCVAPDLTAFQDFIIDELTAAPNVASVKTTLVIRRVKFEPGVPVALAQRRRAG